MANDPTDADREAARKVLCDCRYCHPGHSEAGVADTIATARRQERERWIATARDVGACMNHDAERALLAFADRMEADHG